MDRRDGNQGFARFERNGYSRRRELARKEDGGDRGALIEIQREGIEMVLQARSRVVVCTRQAKSKYVFPFDGLSFYLARVCRPRISRILSHLDARARAPIYLISASGKRVTNSALREREERGSVTTNQADDLGGCIGGGVGR